MIYDRLFFSWFSLYIWKSRLNLEIFNSKFDSTNSTLKMCEKLGHWRDSNPRPPYPRRRVSILVTNVLTTRPQRPLILLQRQITNIHTLSFLSSFVLGVLVIFKPQVFIVSTAQVHIPSRYTHTKCSPFWSDVPTCTFLNSRVSLTRLISLYGYPSLGFIGSNSVSGLIFHTFFKVLFVESNLELNISKFNLDFQIYKVTKPSYLKYSIIIHRNCWEKIA